MSGLVEIQTVLGTPPAAGTPGTPRLIEETRVGDVRLEHFEFANGRGESIPFTLATPDDLSRRFSPWVVH